MRTLSQGEDICLFLACGHTVWMYAFMRVIHLSTMKESLTNTTALMYSACADICLLQWTIGERARSATFWQCTRGEANLFAPSV